MSSTIIDRAVDCNCCMGVGFIREIGFVCSACDGTGRQIVQIRAPELHPVKVNGKKLALFFGAVCVVVVAGYWWVLAPLLYKVFGQ
jgi:hypothetical protein